MEPTPTLCIFCGNDRDPGDDLCPKCGRGWIDHRIAATAETSPPADGGDTQPTPAKEHNGAASESNGAEPDIPQPAELAPPQPVPVATGIAEDSGPTEDPVDDPLSFEQILHPPVAPSPATKPSPMAGSATPGSEPVTEDPAPRTPPSHRVVLALSVIGVIAAWFLVLAWITSQGQDDVGAISPTTTTADDDADDPQATTTDADTTTTVTPTTTTTIPSIEADGEAIDVADLGLGAFALGPLEFGAQDALGRLVATFGQPDSLVPAGTEMGLCEPDAGVAVAWGPLTVIFEGSTEEAVLAGYRLDTDDAHPAAALVTLSGLQVGATVSELESVYSGFTVDYQDIDGSPSFLLRGDNNATLLWGPVASDNGIEDEGRIVAGIYSPLPCDGGPSAGP